MDQSNTRDETTGTPPGIPASGEGAVINAESGVSPPDVEAEGQADRAQAAAEPPATATVPLAIDLPAGLDHAGALQDFRHELARAMRSAAESERERITSAVDGIARAQLEQVRARAAAEADGFRQLADQDVDKIREWSKAEISRIHDEAESRIGARRQQLERHVERHGAITDREVASIESAVEAYRSEVERFFARLTSEEDPAEFARLAATLPAPPDLDEIGGAARTQALDDYRARDATSTDETADARDQSSAFSPTEPGPGLVGVMASGDEATPGVPVMADPAATGEDAREAVPAGSSEASQTDTNGALHRLRALAGFGGKREE